jgi:hypothetical protein
MHVNSFDILELQDWRFFNLDITKKCTATNTIYYVYSERFVKQSFLYGKLHVNLHHIWNYKIIGDPLILTSPKALFLISNNYCYS